MQVFNPKKPFQTIVPIVLCAAVVAAIIYLANAIGIFVVNEPIYRFDTAARLDYAGRTSFEYDDETGELSLKNHGVKEVLDHAPIYYAEDSNKLLMPAQVAVVYPSVLKHGRSGYNMEIVREDDQLTATVRGKDVDVTGAFLYDGNNTYVFLEPVTIALGIEEIELPAYSYAYVYYNLRVELYAPDGSIHLVMQTGDTIVTAIAKDQAYQIDLSRDILQTPDGEILLITDPSVLSYVTAETGKS